jgi:hypothetical protein
MTDDSYTPRKGYCLVPCPVCSYTCEVRIGSSEIQCERCALPDVTAVVRPPLPPLTEAAVNDITERSVASACEDLLRKMEEEGTVDVDLATIGVVIARETIGNTYGYLFQSQAEAEVRRAHDQLAAVREAGAVGSGGVVEESDEPEPDSDGRGTA